MKSLNLELTIEEVDVILHAMDTATYVGLQSADKAIAVARKLIISKNEILQAETE